MYFEALRHLHSNPSDSNREQCSILGDVYAARTVWQGCNALGSCANDSTVRMQRTDDDSHCCMCEFHASQSDPAKWKRIGHSEDPIPE